MDAWRSPTGIGLAHLANEGDYFRRHGRSTWCLRFDDHQGRSPATLELGEPNPQKSVSKAQAAVGGCGSMVAIRGADAGGPESLHEARLDSGGLAEASRTARRRS